MRQQRYVQIVFVAGQDAHFCGTVCAVGRVSFRGEPPVEGGVDSHRPLRISYPHQ